MRDKAKQRQWMKENTKKIVGLRPIRRMWVYTEFGTNSTMEITPETFLYGESRLEPMSIFGPEQVRVHVPRSLCKRARIQVNIHTGQIIGKSAMHTANK